MANFDIAAAFVLDQEDDLTFDPRDPGGATRYGISSRAYPNVDLSTLTSDGAKLIYKRDYWRFDALPQPLANLMLSLAVNCGLATAIHLLQKTVGVPQDGLWGALTEGAANRTPNALHELAAYAIVRYANDKDAPVYLLGWVRRVLEAL